jgi:hypothetical protein
MNQNAFAVISQVITSDKFSVLVLSPYGNCLYSYLRLSLPLSSENLSSLVPTLCSYMKAPAGSVIHFKLQSCAFHTVVMKDLFWVLMTALEVEEAFAEANLILLKVRLRQMCLQLLNANPPKLKSLLAKEDRRTRRQMQEFTARSLSATRKTRVSKGILKHYSVLPTQNYLTFSAKEDVSTFSRVFKAFDGCVLTSSGAVIYGAEAKLVSVREHLSQIAVKLHEERGGSRVPVSGYLEIAKLELFGFKTRQLYALVYCPVLDGLIVCSFITDSKLRGRVPIKENYSFEFCKAYPRA